MREAVSPRELKSASLGNLMGYGKLLRVVEASLPEATSVVGVAGGAMGMANANVVVVITETEVMLFEKTGIRWSSMVSGLRAETTGWGVRFTPSAGPSQEFRTPVIVRSRIARLVNGLSSTAPVRCAEIAVTVLHARGLDVQPGARLGLDLRHDSVALIALDTGLTIAEAAGPHLVEFAVGGPGLLDEHAGFIGGGLGIQGAAKGVAAARS